VRASEYEVCGRGLVTGSAGSSGVACLRRSSSAASKMTVWRSLANRICSSLVKCLRLMVGGKLANHAAVSGLTGVSGRCLGLCRRSLELEVLKYGNAGRVSNVSRRCLVLAVNVDRLRTCGRLRGEEEPSWARRSRSRLEKYWCQAQDVSGLAHEQAIARRVQQSFKCL
jgi:hypothetical protein